MDLLRYLKNCFVVDFNIPIISMPRLLTLSNILKMKTMNPLVHEMHEHHDLGYDHKKIYET